MVETREQQQRARITARGVRGLALLTLAAGVAVSLLAWRSSAAAERRAIGAAFRLEAEDLHRAVLREFNLFSDVLQSLGALLSLSDRISDEDFEEFISKGMLHQQQLLGAYGFAQHIPAPLRESVERDSAPILEPAPDGSYAPAGARDDYFPLTYQYPPNGLGLPLGFDLGAVEDNQTAIRAMEARRGPAAGGMVTDPRDGRTGVTVMAPVFMYAPAADTPGVVRESLAGCSVAILWPQQLLHRALALIHARDKLISLYSPRQPREDPRRQPQALVYEAPMPVMNETWTFRCMAQEGYLAARSTGRPTLLLASGLAVTLLLAVQFLFLARRTAEIEQVVRQRTAALTESNRKLEEAMAERRRLENEYLEFSAREQQRLGRDLHDSLGQKLTGAVFLSRALAGQLEDMPASERETAVKLNEILKESVAQVRRIAKGLSPIDMTDGGLDQALKRLAEETCDVYSVHCTYESSGGHITNSVTASHLFQIAQESVTNAIRHGQAREVTIKLAVQAGQGSLVVSDNGSGFVVRSDDAGGMGLRIMRYRAAMIDGELAIAPGSQGGTVVTCVFPA